MKLLQYVLLGAICLAIVDKWGQLGVIWPETSRKVPDRPRTVSNWHPSVAKHQNVVSFDDYQRWYRQQWSVE